MTIPTNWRPHHRDEDGELVGYLAPEGTAYVPMTLLGTPLSPATAEEAAEEALENTGLSYLADDWIMTEADGSERRVAIVEIDPDRVVVQNTEFAKAIGGQLDDKGRAELPVPAEALRRRG